MWRLIIFSLSILCNARGDEQVLKVMTWNLKWFPGGAPASNVETQTEQINAVAKVIEEASPDILILQEVQALAPLEETLKLAKSSLVVHVFSKFKTLNGILAGQQIAICSRFPAEAAWFAVWEKGWADAPRGYAYTCINTGSNLLMIYGLHLKSNLGNDPQGNTAKREDAVEQVLRHANEQQKEMKTDTVIVGGDFNTAFEGNVLPSEKTLKNFIDNNYFWPFEGVPLEKRITIYGHGKYPDACFDHLFLKNLGRPVAKVITNAKGSDHLPVIVEVNIPKSVKIEGGDSSKSSEK